MERFRRIRPKLVLGVVVVVILVCAGWMPSFSYIDGDNNNNSFSNLFASRLVQNKNEKAMALDGSSFVHVATIPRRPVKSLRQNLQATISGGTTSTTTKPLVDKYLGKCRPSSQVRILYNTTRKVALHNDTHQEEHHYNWILQSLDDQGQPKTQGGDEFYISYFDEKLQKATKTSRRKYKNNSIMTIDPTAVALVQDNHDGTYTLDFVTTPMHPQHQMSSSSRNRRKRGTLHIFFQYTCGIGSLSPPSKESWQSGGRSDLYFMTKVPWEPPIRLFQPPYHESNLSQFSSVFFVGDSLFLQLVRETSSSATHTERRHGTYFRPHTYMADPIQSELTMATVQTKFLNHLDSRHGQELNGMVPAGSSAMQKESENMALLIGSSVWDILAATKHNYNHQNETFFENHLLACRVYVNTVRQRYPDITVFWKSGTAMHVHRLPANCTKDPSCNQRTKYMSNSRALLLYTKQKELMHELGVPFLDLFESTYLSGYRSREGDGRHYTNELNDLISKFIFGLDG